jgi:hypothetical protein
MGTKIGKKVGRTTYKIGRKASISGLRLGSPMVIGAGLSTGQPEVVALGLGMEGGASAIEKYAPKKV